MQGSPRAALACAASEENTMRPVAAPGEGKKNPPDPAKVFARKDTNKDGLLTLDEFKTGMKDKQLERAPQRFKTIDANGDGKVSMDEFKAGSKPKS